LAHKEIWGMALVKLAGPARSSLQAIVRQTGTAREVKRAQALLWLHAGQPINRVAAQLGVSRRTIERWAERFRNRQDAPVAERVRSGQHTGRPAKQLKLARRVIEKVLDRDPRRYGFRALVWTVPMLRCLIHQRAQTWLGHATIRRALRSLRQRYKRPRLVLARRAPHWRQAKGGLNAG
jgi:transposase